MQLGLRARLVGGAAIAMLLFLVIMLIAVRVTVAGDLRDQAHGRVAAGSDAFVSALQSRIDQTRDVAAQVAQQANLQQAVATRDRATLHTILEGLQLPNGFSYAAVVDTHGNAIARANEVDTGAEPSDLAKAALNDSVVAGIDVVSWPLLKAELLTIDAEPFRQAPTISAAAPILVNGKVVGSLLVGTLLVDETRLVDSVGKFTGGGAAIAMGGTVVASSIERADGSRAIGVPVGATVDGTPYVTLQQPLVDYAGNRVASIWIGITQASLYAVADRAMLSMMLWGLVAFALAIGLAVLAADRLGDAIVKRSREVNESARELEILVVGSEVSEDHAGQTTARLAVLANDLEHAAGGNGALSGLIGQTRDDVVVLNVLTGELAERMRDARERVAQLGSVARGLDAIVAGAQSSRN